MSWIKTPVILLNAPGPVWVINFEDIDDEEEKEKVSRDAYEIIIYATPDGKATNPPVLCR